MALCKNLKFYSSMSKGSKLKVRKFWGLIPTFVEVTGEKTSSGAFLAPPLSWIGLTFTNFETPWRSLTEYIQQQFTKSLSRLTLVYSCGRFNCCMSFLNQGGNEVKCWPILSWWGTTHNTRYKASIEKPACLESKGKLCKYV